MADTIRDATGAQLAPGNAAHATGIVRRFAKWILTSRRPRRRRARGVFGTMLCDEEFDSAIGREVSYFGTTRSTSSGKDSLI